MLFEGIEIKLRIYNYITDQCLIKYNSRARRRRERYSYQKLGIVVYTQPTFRIIGPGLIENKFTIGVIFNIPYINIQIKLYFSGRKKNAYSYIVI